VVLVGNENLLQYANCVTMRHTHKLASD